MCICNNCVQTSGYKGIGTVSYTVVKFGAYNLRVEHKIADSRRVRQQDCGVHLICPTEHQLFSSVIRNTTFPSEI